MRIYLTQATEQGEHDLQRGLRLCLVGYSPRASQVWPVPGPAAMSQQGKKDHRVKSWQD